MSTMSNLMTKVYNMVGSKTEKKKVQFKELDYEKFWPRLGWFLMETIKKTFENTTQLYMNSPTFHPFRKHYKS